MPTRGTSSRRIAVSIAVAVAVSVAAPLALAGQRTTPKLIGNAKAGKTVFTTTCAGCHTLKAAGAHGTIGPSLDKAALTEAVLIKAVTNGGATVMTAAARAKYQVPMAAFKGTLSAAQIQNVAAFVYTSTHK